MWSKYSLGTTKSNPGNGPSGCKMPDKIPNVGNKSRRINKR